MGKLLSLKGSSTKARFKILNQLWPMSRPDGGEYLGLEKQSEGKGKKKLEEVG